MDRRAHLHRARGRDGRGIAVKVEAAILPIEPARHDETPAFAFLVGDQRLIVDLDHPAGQRGPPMVHQPFVGDAIGGEVAEVVAERIAHAEQGLVHRIAAVHRSAPDMDDARVGQRERDQPDIEAIERRLVDRERRVGSRSAMRAR